MSKVLIFCRSWVDFTDEFPFIDELNCLPNDDISGDVEKRIVSWFRENRPAVKAKYRNLTGSAGEGPESLAGWKKACREARRGFKGFDGGHKKTNRAKKRTTLAEYARDFAERNREDRTDYDGPRGERTDKLGVRIARIMGWTYIAGDRFGGDSPSKMMPLAWTDATTAETAIEVLQERFDGLPAHVVINLKFASLPANAFSAARRAHISLKFDDAVKGINRREGDLCTDLHRILIRDAEDVLGAIRNDAKQTGLAPATDSHENETPATGTASGDSGSGNGAGAVKSVGEKTGEAGVRGESRTVTAEQQARLDAILKFVEGSDLWGNSRTVAIQMCVTTFDRPFLVDATQKTRDIAAIEKMMGVLKNARSWKEAQVRDPGGKSGIDRDGREWRKVVGHRLQWYVLSSLPSKPKSLQSA